MTKIIKKANDEKVDCDTITARYISEFCRDSETLGLMPPTVEPRATLHMAEIIALIQRLEEKELAYRVDGDVYFPVERFKGYGKLARKKIDDVVGDQTIDLDGLVQGLTAGQRIIVTGELDDQRGVYASEPAQLMKVEYYLNDDPYTHLTLAARLTHKFVRDTVTINANAPHPLRHRQSRPARFV